MSCGALMSAYLPWAGGQGKGNNELWYSDREVKG